MIPQLRPYQQATVALARKAFGKHKHVLLVSATGSGKTFMFSEIVRSSLGKGYKVMIVSNRAKLLKQAGGSLIKFGITAEYISAKHRIIPVNNCIVASAQTLQRRFDFPEYQELFKSVDLWIFDECHLQDFNFLLESGLLDKKWLLGVTATPKRAGKQRQLGLDYEVMVEGLSVQGGIDLGFLVPARTFTLDAPDLSSVSIDPIRGDYNGKDLYKVFNTSKVYGGVISEFKRLCNNEKTMCFCSNQIHAIQTCIEFNKAGISSKFVVSGLKKEDEDYNLLEDNLHLTGRKEDIEDEFDRGEFTVLCNVAIYTTGYDCVSIKNIIMLRATLSETLYDQCLDSKTEVLTIDGWANIESINKDVKVAAFDINSSEVTYEDVISIYKRPLNDGEKMFGLKNNYTDIRVTEGHRMLVSRRVTVDKIRQYSQWEFCDANKIRDKYHEFYVPISGIIERAGSGLCDNDLLFLGLFLSDGHLNKCNNAIHICQSVNSPHVGIIEECILKCNFKYGKRIIERTETNFANASNLAVFNISKGKPIGKDLDKTGWERLGRYIDKSLSHYDDFTKEEWGKIINGLNIGNGSKSEKISWERHTYAIAVRDGIFADKLQSLLVVLGFKCSIRPSPTKCWMVYIKPNEDRKNIHTDTSDSRPVFGQLESISGELVWCVENIKGTLITRRNGSITIVGNCIGRGSRIMPDGGKSFFRILDFGGNVARHGLYERNKVNGLWHDTKEGNGVVMSKLCDPMKTDKEGKHGCGRLIPIFYPVCPFKECGFIFKTPEELKEIELKEIIGGEFRFRDMSAIQLRAYAQLNGYKMAWVYRQLYMGNDERGFRRGMGELGYESKFIYMTLQRFKKK